MTANGGGPVLEHRAVMTEGDQSVSGLQGTAWKSDTPSVIPIRVAAVRVVDRHRKDLGDLTDLAESINDIGLLNPITVTRDLRLIAGERRLRAVELLGREEIAANVVHSIVEARDILVVERDENTKRKAMLPSEAATLGLAIEEIERPAAATRQAESTKHAANMRWGNASGSGDPDAQIARPRDLAAEAIGMSEPTYRRIKQAMSTAADVSEPESVRDAAREAVSEIDAGKPVYPQMRKIAEAREALGFDRSVAGQKAKWARISEMADERLTSAQIASRVGLTEQGLRSEAKKRGIEFPADEFVRRTRRVDPVRVIESTVASIEASEMALQLVDFSAITSEQALDWLARMKSAMRSLHSLQTTLKEIR